MNTWPCDGKLSQDQRRFIKKSRRKDECVNSDELIEEFDQKLFFLFL